MLKDARGYRSPYINALNGAVAAARVVGGDVIPEETPSGTLLTIAQTRRAGRFELFCGYDNGGERGADAFCLSDGTLYVAAVAQELKSGRDVFRRDGELQPRASGWCTQKTIKDGETLTFACVRYKGAYYLIAQKDGESVIELLPENLGEIDPAQIEELFTFGQFYWAGKTGDKSIQIRQDVHGDVWYGGSGVAQEETPYAWRVRAVTQPEPEPGTPEEGGGNTETPEGGEPETPEGGEPETPPEEQSYGYQVFAPIAVINGSALQEAPDGYTTASSWQDIPREDTEASSSSGFTLYAILRYAPASGGSSGGVQEGTGLSFTFKSGLPDTSKDPKGTIYRLIPIAKVDGEGAITQLHAGVIIETFPPANLFLGPIEYDDQTKNVVQFLGSYDASGNFKKAVDANGQYLIGADYGKPLSALRAESSDSIYTFTGFRPLGVDEKYGKFAEKQTFNGASKDLVYTPPETEDGMGALSGISGISFDFWGSKPSEGTPTTFLQTVIESANDKNTYESASS